MHVNNAENKERTAQWKIAKYFSLSASKKQV